MIYFLIAMDELRTRLRGERGDINLGGAGGTFALIVIVLFIAWLLVRADILNVP